MGWVYCLPIRPTAQLRCSGLVLILLQCAAIVLPAGVDLFYQDRLSAPGHPFLFGAALPWDYGEVFTPGASYLHCSLCCVHGAAMCSRAFNMCQPFSER